VGESGVTRFEREYKKTAARRKEWGPGRGFKQPSAERLTWRQSEEKGACVPVGLSPAMAGRNIRRRLVSTRLVGPESCLEKHAYVWAYGKEGGGKGGMGNGASPDR
jgi:hypothetical protein